jgi:hypothetical protein
VFFRAHSYTPLYGERAGAVHVICGSAGKMEKNGNFRLKISFMKKPNAFYETDEEAFQVFKFLKTPKTSREPGEGCHPANV